MPDSDNFFWSNGKPHVALSVNAGAVLKEISDALGLADALLCNKTINLIDNVASLESVLGNKPALLIADAISFADSALTPSRVLWAIDNVGISDDALIQKLLKINENISLVEIVEKGVSGGVKKTRLFLILGDLAIQLSSD
jgi:hypothetical protein